MECAPVPAWGRIGSVAWLVGQTCDERAANASVLGRVFAAGRGHGMDSVVRMLPGFVQARSKPPVGRWLPLRLLVGGVDRKCRLR